MHPLRPASSLRIVVLGFIVRGPVGGMVCSNLQYLLGLRALGHDVYFVEDSGDEPSCYDPRTHLVGTDPSYGLAFAERLLAPHGLSDRWAYHDTHGRGWVGPAAHRILETVGTADLVLNLAGVNRLRPWLEGSARLVLVDEDPVFTQVRHLADTHRRDEAAAHDAFFTFGENIGHSSCAVPDDGFPWQPTRPPIHLPQWPISPRPSADRFTTVMQWQSYSPVEHAGTTYGLKGDSFEPFIDLPSTTSAVLELAVGGSHVPRERLARHRWALHDALDASRDLDAYRRYIQGSTAELSVAKHAYAVTRSGWFSERSACYLASGRPAVVQDTGFGSWLSTGDGVLPFHDRPSAAAAVADVLDRYDVHAAAARQLAAEVFDTRQVLPPLLEAAMAVGTTRR